MSCQNKWKKTLVTERPIQFKEGQGANYRNTHFIVDHEIRVDGTLELFDCMVEIREGRVHGNGAIRFFNCDVVGTSQTIPGINVLIHAPQGYFGGCRFKDFPGVHILTAKEITGCKFDCCGLICAGYCGENNRIENSEFTDCEIVIVDNGYIENCKFVRLKDTLYVTTADVMDCEFVGVRCDNDCFISMEDGEITKCSFGEVELTNGAYLIDAVGISMLDRCKFENIYTDRDDGELLHCEGVAGKIFKRKKEFSFVNKETCVGLDKVTNVKSEIDWSGDYGWSELRAGIPKAVYIQPLDSGISVTEDNEPEMHLPEVGSKGALPSKNPIEDIDIIRRSFREIDHKETGER